MLIEINKVMITGRVSRPPKTTTMRSGKSVCNFSIAFNKRISAEERKASFFTVKCFGKTAEFAEKYLSKGKAVYIEGSISTDEWTDKEDASKRHSMTYIIADIIRFAESKDEESRARGPQGATDYPVSDDMPF